MRKLVLAVITLFLIDMLLTNCANPQPVTGGVKDTIPPVLIRSLPEDQTLNFRDRVITLTFDEFVSADKIKQNLIITPITEVKYKVFPKKQIITLTFEDDFEDSTTYTLNFFDGITDITERNPAENLILAFSTTNYIDSLTIAGKITDLMSGAPKEKMTVGLYRATDTLDLTKVKPTYFITTDKQGRFQLQNIRQNPYILMSYMDENKNLLFDPASEAYAFLSDTIDLKESIEDSVYLNALSINAAKLNFISARPTGLYFEARYSKPLTNYSLDYPGDTIPIGTDFTSEKESIRFFNNINLSPEDSITTFLTVYDSLGNSITDTLHVKFRESVRKPDEYKASLVPPSGTILDDTRFTINFSKPSIKITDSTLIYIPIDTLFKLPVPTLNARFNFNRTKYSFGLPPDFKTYLADTLQNLTQSYEQTDTLNIDSAQLLIYKKLSRISANNFALTVRNNSFASIENDTLSALTGNYKFSTPEDFGTVQVNITTDEPSYIVQLMSKEQVVTQTANCKTCVFNNVPPGNYWVRILVDKDGNGKWSPGNFQKFVSPEPVIHFTEATSLRANWQIELDYSF